MYKRIMVALDQSFMTDRVLETAIELAKSTGAQVAICHAIDETVLAQRDVAMMLPNSVGKTEARLRMGAEGFLGKAAEKARAAGLEVEIKVVESEQKHVSDMLIEAAAEWRADLLVVGTHGAGPIGGPPCWWPPGTPAAASSAFSLAAPPRAWFARGAGPCCWCAAKIRPTNGHPLSS